jgi:hypothetical protein
LDSFLAALNRLFFLLLRLYLRKAIDEYRVDWVNGRWVPFPKWWLIAQRFLEIHDGGERKLCMLDNRVVLTSKTVGLISGLKEQVI